MKPPECNRVLRSLSIRSLRFALLNTTAGEIHDKRLQNRYPLVHLQNRYSLISHIVIVILWFLWLVVIFWLVILLCRCPPVGISLKEDSIGRELAREVKGSEFDSPVTRYAIQSNV